jgi:hypothetical protein
VKAGSFIPMTKLVSTTDNYKSDNFIVRYYPADTSYFIQYEDDGWDNLALKTGNFERITYSGKQDNGVIRFEITHQGGWKGMPADRAMEIQVLRKTLASRVLINGKTIVKSGNPKPGISSYQLQDGWMKIHFTWHGDPVKIEIQDSKNKK